MSVENEFMSVIRTVLREGEQVIWAGKPKQGIHFNIFDTFLIPFSIAWGGFSFVWEAIAIWSGAPFIFPLFGIPFVIIGYQLMIGRFFTDANIRKKTLHVITNQRAMTIFSGKETQVTSWDLAHIKTVSTTEKKDGSGNLTFGLPASNGSANIPFPWLKPTFGPVFNLIPDVKKAKIAIEEGLKSDTGGSFWENTNSDIQYSSESGEPAEIVS